MTVTLVRNGSGRCRVRALSLTVQAEFQEFSPPEQVTVQLVATMWTGLVATSDKN
jgi:hypothetical protein